MAGEETSIDALYEAVNQAIEKEKVALAEVKEMLPDQKAALQEKLIAYQNLRERSLNCVTVITAQP